MANKVYLSGNMIVVDNGTTVQKINSGRIDYNIDTNGNFTLYDGIIKQSYELGIFSNNQTSAGVAYASKAAFEAVLDSICNVTGNSGSASGSVQDVAIQDQSTEIIDLHLTKLVNAVTVLTDTNLDDVIINIDSSSLPVAGQILCLKEGTAFYQGEVLSVAAVGGTEYNVTVDTPLDYAYTVLGGCSLRSKNLNVNGSVTPQIFSVTPANLTAGTEWDITRILFQITDDVAMDDAKFGGIAKLTNGIVVRKKDGTYKNIFNIKTNGDFALHAYDITYSDKAPAGFYGIRCRRSFNGFDKNGVVVRLATDTSDELQVIIQDDLSALATFEVVAQGHIVEN